MALNLTKGQNAKLENGQDVLRLGLSWDSSKNSFSDYDLDVLVIELDSKDLDTAKAISDKNVVFYNSEVTENGKPTNPEHSIIHSGDNRTGDGEGDDESLRIILSKLNPKTEAILAVINIYEGKERGQNFGQVKNSKARLYYGDSQVAELVYDLEEDYSSSVCMEFCMIYKNNNVWKFKAIGEGNKNNLLDELSKFGLPIEGNA